MQGLMSRAEVGLIPRAEGATQGLRSESGKARVSMESAGRPESLWHLQHWLWDRPWRWSKVLGHQLTPVLTTRCLGHQLGSRETWNLRAGRDQAIMGMRRQRGLAQKGEGLTQCHPVGLGQQWHLLAL